MTLPVREPTWPGLEPDLPDLIVATPAEARRVRDATGFTGEVATLTFGGRRDTGIFRVDTDDRGPVLVKLIEPVRRETALRAEAVAAWLHARGLAVAAPLDGAPRQLADGGLAVAMPYVEGRRVRADETELRALGSTLAALHLALARHPERLAWAEATRRRLAALDAVRDRLAAGETRVGPEPDRLAELAADRELDFALPAETARPLHGDLNPGNVLLAGGEIVLLDFEDVSHSVLPLVFELALAVERFVLVRVAEDAAAVALGRALLRGYADAGGALDDVRAADSVRTLRALALRSLLVLASAEARGGADAEWRKFFALERQATIRADVIRKIFEAPGA